MKKTIFVFVIAFTALQSCKVLSTVKEYDNDVGYLYIKPVNIDTMYLSLDSKVYSLEGHLADGTPAIFMVKERILIEIMRIQWPTTAKAGDLVKGYGFTINDRGRKSILTKNDILGKKVFGEKRKLLGQKREESIYDKKQQDFLLRNRNTRKFDLVSSLPYDAIGRTQGKKIILVTNVSQLPQTAVDWYKELQQKQN
jgi:hypothetical protein